MVDLRAGGLVLDPEQTNCGLHDVLEDDRDYDLGARDKVARLDFLTLMDAEPVQPLPLGHIEEVEEDAESPICDYGRRKSKEVIWEP